eukprot:symbB.v1.2.004202.t1/scaffold238.1/size305685/5
MQLPHNEEKQGQHLRAFALAFDLPFGLAEAGILCIAAETLGSSAGDLGCNCWPSWSTLKVEVGQRTSNHREVCSPKPEPRFQLRTGRFATCVGKGFWIFWFDDQGDHSHKAIFLANSHLVHHQPT